MRIEIELRPAGGPEHDPGGHGMIPAGGIGIRRPIGYNRPPSKRTSCYFLIRLASTLQVGRLVVCYIEEVPSCVSLAQGPNCPVLGFFLPKTTQDHPLTAFTPKTQLSECHQNAVKGAKTPLVRFLAAGRCLKSAGGN